MLKASPFLTSTRLAASCCKRLKLILTRPPPPEASPFGQPVGCLSRGCRRPSAVILCRSPRAAERVMASVTRFVEHRLKLTVNQTKSKVCEIKDATFLGFTIVRNKIKRSEKSKTKFRWVKAELTVRDIQVEIVAHGNVTTRWRDDLREPSSREEALGSGISSGRVTQWHRFIAARKQECSEDG